MRQILLLTLILVTAAAYAQSIDKAVLASAGKTAEAHMIMQYTVGETCIATHIKYDYTLGEGFQRVVDEGVLPEETDTDTTIMELMSVADMDVNIFPNPASDFINIQTATTHAFELYIYGSDGALLYETRLTASCATIPLVHLPAGILFMQLSDLETHTYQLFQLIHI